MRSMFAGGTDYSLQPDSELAADLEQMAVYASEVSEIATELCNVTADSDDVPSDLLWFAPKALSLARSIVEIRDNSASCIREGRAGENTGQRLRSLGDSARSLNYRIGRTWNADVPARYKRMRRWETAYSTLSDFFASMIDLDNMGHAIGERHPGPDDAPSPPKPTVLERFQRLPVVSSILLIGLVVGTFITFVTAAGWAKPLWIQVSAPQRIPALVAGVPLERFTDVLGEPDFRKKDGQLKEFVYVDPRYYVQAVTDQSDRVVMFAVTTRSSEFAPSFDIPGGNSEFFRGPIQLGVSTFDDVAPEPQFIAGAYGATWDYYCESFYLANPGNYQSFAVADSPAGLELFTADDWGDVDVFGVDQAISEQDYSSPALTPLRMRMRINTYAEFAPGFDANALFDEGGLAKSGILVGADRAEMGALEQ